MGKFEGGTQSPREIEEFVTEMLGPEHASTFWKQYREIYYTREDLHRKKQIGFDSVRVPIHYKFFGTDDAEEFRLLAAWLVGAARKTARRDRSPCRARGQTGANMDDNDGYPWLFKDASAQQQRM